MMVMDENVSFLDWSKGILCILVLSIVIVSLDLLVEVIISPSTASIVDRLLYRFGLMFMVSFVTFLIVFHILRTRVFVMPER